MASREQFAAWAVEGNGNGATPEWMKSWAAQQGSGGGGGSPSMSRPPPQARMGEQASLLPPMPQSVVPLKQPAPTSGPPQRRGHGRSRSDVVWAGPPALQSDLSHPFNRGGTSPRMGGPKPPRRTTALPPAPAPQSTLAPVNFGSPTDVRKVGHRRTKSDIPLLIGGRNSISTSGRIITKADLLKNLPNPRWGGAKPSMHHRNRSRTGSDGQPLLDASSVSSGYSGAGYGAMSATGFGMAPMLQSIGSVELPPDARRASDATATRHVRAMSDASAHSVTTDMAKSALFKGVTDTGTLQLQLPKDSFRLLMDKQLEAGQVYKRKLVDDEDQFFVEFHLVNDDDNIGERCQCTCDKCNRCNEKQKNLPPDLYVMAVDSTIYRRMLDEVIASKTMPCGLFFCGHHEDVRHPDITIAALVVGLVFFLLMLGAVIIWD